MKEAVEEGRRWKKEGGGIRKAMEERKGRGYKEEEGGVLEGRRWRCWIYFWGKLDFASGGKMKKNLRRGITQGGEYL